MYFVPDGTKRCGFYECTSCANRFLALQIAPKITCPYCGEEPDMELGPDDVMSQNGDTARLVSVVEGADEVEKTDTLLSLAVTGGDYEWI